MRAAVFRLLAQRWSPEQIAHGLLQQYPEDPTMRISHEAIYTYYLYVLPRGAFKRELARYLRRRHLFRRPHKVRLWSRPSGTSLASTNGQPRSPIGRCRAIGRAACLSAMLTRLHWECRENLVNALFQLNASRVNFARATGSLNSLN
ncbi:MAG TPA: hypothetical protein VKP13_17110 [Nitrospira sp.]|nr:hypothetical protein [Nitrospira sp.]